MPKKSEVEFANFVLRFGQEYYLIDLFEEIVLPAFGDPYLVRGYGSTEFLFRDVSLQNIGSSESPTLILAGRFIKNTYQTREQYLDHERNELVRDDSSMQISPSSIFIIILNHHRMMFYGETKDAPSLSSFRITSENFIKQKFQEYIDECHKKGLGTKKSLRDIYSPSLNIVPLTSEETIQQFIQRYDILETMEISLINPNQENDNDDFFPQARRRQQSIMSDKTSIIDKNKRIGLSLTQVTNQLIFALKNGNSEFKLKGKDRDGNTLEGNNERLNIKHRFSNESITLNGIIDSCIRKFNELVDNNIINIPERDLSVFEKIRQIWINRSSNE